jgi:hypothetical protein
MKCSQTHKNVVPPNNQAHAAGFGCWLGLKNRD